MPAFAVNPPPHRDTAFANPASDESASAAGSYEASVMYVLSLP
ncbi:hypothetical protein ACIQXA_10205 [Streptomyces massasporeus]